MTDAQDLVGRARVQDGHIGNGLRVDMGAYEINVPPGGTVLIVR